MACGACGQGNSVQARNIRNPGGGVRYVVEGGRLDEPQLIADRQEARRLAQAHGARMRVVRV